MILPSKFLPAERSLIVLGSEILNELRDYPLSVSEIWERMSAARRNVPLAFDWFVLALTLLYAMKAIELDKNLVRLLQVSG